MMEEVGDERSTEEQDDINRTTGDDIKPEYGIIIIVCRLFEVCNRISEPTVLQGCPNQREDADHPNHSIFRRRQQSAEDNTEDQSQQLLETIIQPSPKETFRRPFLQ